MESSDVTHFHAGFGSMAPPDVEPATRGREEDFLAARRTCSAWRPTARPPSKAMWACWAHSRKASLPAATHERIALAVAEANGCDYCLSAHTWLGKNVAKLDDSEMAANRRGNSNWIRARAAAVRFARQVMAQPWPCERCRPSRRCVMPATTTREIIEIGQHVALNTWTNYLNSVAQTAIDFPVVPHARLPEVGKRAAPPRATWPSPTGEGHPGAPRLAARLSRLEERGGWNTAA